ncbi:MAG: alpha/beta fold hydrolase [Deltaproteobacteria bacterium]
MLGILLTFFFIIVFVTLFFIIWAYFWHWFYFASTAQDDTHYFRTRDRWRLAIHRYRPVGLAKRHPVILCHGLSSNRYTFDLPGAPSLARFLKRHGWDVWVAELRGSGESDHPEVFRSDVPYTWHFEDHLREDVPAIITRVIELTGAPAVHWVGHSMGGLLVQAYLAANENPLIASAVTVGSPSDFSHMDNNAFHLLLRLRWVARYCPIFPLPFLNRLVTPFAHRLHDFFGGLFYAPNVYPQTISKFLALGAQLVTSGTLWLDFGRFLETGVFGPGDGTTYTANLPASRVPLLIMGGSRDGFAPEAAVKAADAMTGDAVERESIILGKGSGCSEDYGHVDLLVGKRVELEVFPLIHQWVENHDQ